ncbi:Uncharacterized protein TCAP_05470 [Tolypocladium capitatum]|uniref:Uncharacterized protein n=1 Tax=Tolypocladium capitatum TaxID=45235 RepID=A0A2K3QAL0_9HYPO|nr:Uncharacterized protein TCAP_05470 [Tolypocladium capitatum]
MADKQIVLITGANKGIGFETVKALIESPKPYHIFLGSRSLSRGEDALAKLNELVPQTASTVELIQIDVTDDDSITKATEVVKNKFGKLDILINNAGAVFDNTTQFNDDIGKFRRVLNDTYNTNTTGAQVTTAAFVPLLLASKEPRLLFITSGIASFIGFGAPFFPPWGKLSAGWPKKDFVGFQGYKSSKAALNMLFLSWHHILKEEGVKTFCVSPGFLATNLGNQPDILRKLGAREPDVGGQVIRTVVEGQRDADVGKVIMENGIQPW